MGTRHRRQRGSGPPRDLARRSPEPARDAHEEMGEDRAYGRLHAGPTPDPHAPLEERRRLVATIQQTAGNAAAQRCVQRLQGDAAQRPDIPGRPDATASRGVRGQVARATGGGTAATTERVAGALWATDSEGKALPPSLDDISQGGLNDCFLFAAMAALVNTNPQRIVNMIRDNGDGTYTVTFKGIGLFSASKQTVSADFAVGKHGNVTARKATWPLIIEKAYAQEKGGLDAFDEGGNPGSAVDDMLNDGPSRFDPRDETVGYIVGKLTKAKQEKWPMTMLAPKKEGASKEKKAMADGTPGLYFWHAYTILDIDPLTNRVKLFNPWGRDHPNGDGWMPIEQVRQFFIEISIND